MSSRVIAAAGAAVFLLVAGGPVVDAGARSNARPVLTPISARFVESTRATVYTVQLKTSDGANLAGGTYVWKLEPPADDPSCDEFRVSATDPREATWFHSDDDGCKHAGTDHNGTVRVTVTSGPYTCTAMYAGSSTGTGPDPAACAGNEPRSCNDELVAVAKARELVKHLEGQIERATAAKKDATVDVVYAKGIITGIESEPPGFWEKVAGADAYLGRLERAEQELAKAQKALSDVTKELVELTKQLRAAKDALAKAQQALKDCQRQKRSMAGSGGATACEAQAMALAVATVRATTAAKAHKSLWSPALRARGAVRAALARFGKPPPALPSSLRAKHSAAVSRTKEAETGLSRLLSGLDAALTSTRRARTAAAAKLAACQKRLG